MATGPAIHEGALWIEGCRTFQLEHFRSKVDQFLTWGGGGAFTTYAQWLNFRNIQNFAFLASVHPLKTDVCATTKGFSKIAKHVK